MSREELEAELMAKVEGREADELRDLLRQDLRVLTRDELEARALDALSSGDVAILRPVAGEIAKQLLSTEELRLLAVAARGQASQEPLSSGGLPTGAVSAVPQAPAPAIALAPAPAPRDAKV